MRYWVFTTKPGHFNMADALVPGQTLDWPTFSRFKFEVGDIVIFYASNPVLQMIGKLEIENNNLPFNEADPRNDLRKWPKHHSYIPWMRLRVLQRAPIPFKPLQRGSLYYHTEFKPSPYPKLLHEGEIEYVMRAFDEAMTYSAETMKYEGGVNPEALARVSRGEILQTIGKRLIGSHVSSLDFNSSESSISLILILPATDSPSQEKDSLTLHFGGVKRAKWDYEQSNFTISGIRLTLENTYLLANIDGAEIEILSETITIN